MLRFDGVGQGRKGKHLPPQVSRVMAMDGGLVLGFADGGLEFHPDEPGGEILRFNDLPTHGVTRIIRGPANMVVAGFADGQVGMWELPSGRRSLKAQLHGQIKSLRMGREALVALSALGQVRLWDFSIYGLDRCALLRKAWKLLPTIWEGGRRVLRGPEAGHPCLGNAE